MAIELNDEQDYIVKYEGDKFLSVQAGPGSGKTRVVVEKVKHMGVIQLIYGLSVIYYELLII